MATTTTMAPVRSLQVRIDRLQQRIARSTAATGFQEREARRLREESRDIETPPAQVGPQRPEPAANMRRSTRRIQRLEQRIFRDANDGNRWAR